MYNRYRGNSGFVERVEDRPTQPSPPPPPAPPQQHTPPPPPRTEPEQPPPRPGGPPDWPGRLLRALAPDRLETEDLMLIGLFYLLYRETGDTDFLFLLAGIFLF